MIPNKWNFYTSPAQDRFLEDLDVKESSKKEIHEILATIAYEAFCAGYREANQENEA